MPPSEADLPTQVGHSPERVDDARGRVEAGPRRRPLVRGDTLGRYVVLERIGVGGMGEVFAAYDPELDRKVAVKLLLPTGGDAPTSASAGPARLLREAQAMAKLRHRNVITVHDVGTHEGRVFVAMEFVEGGTLADWMAEVVPHPWPVVLERFAEAGRGLAAAHAAGLIHRDFKPANVLVGSDGQVQVADFGLVRRASGDAIQESPPTTPTSEPGPASEVTLDADATLLAESGPSGASTRTTTGSHHSLSMRMTQTGTTLGTPAYMAPEQYRGGSVDARADQFSFCVAVWEALYGQRPFAGDNLHALMFAINQGAIREPASERDVPGAIRRVLVRGLANDPNQRWPDMDALLTALRWDPSARRRRWTLAGVGVALVAVTTLGLLSVPEDPPPPLAPPPPCIGAEAAFGDALSPARRDAIAERFGSFEHAWARDVGDRLFPRLDDWALEWQAAWTDTCEATEIRGEQSEDLFDRRMLCLDRQRRSFIGLVDALGQADEALAKRSDTLFDEIGSLASCSDSEALLRIIPLPDNPIVAAAILRAEAAIADGTREYLAGRYPEARALLELQREAVTVLDHAPLSASFEHLDGWLALTLDDRAGGETALERAFARALAAGDDERATKIARTLASSLSELDRGRDALRWLDIAGALAERDGNDDQTLGDLALTRSQTLASLGDYPGAEKAAQAAYDHLTRAGSKSSRVGDALYLLGVAAYRAGRPKQTIERVEQARAAWTSQIGPRHPRTSAALTLLAVASRSEGKYVEAQGYFEEALAIEVANLGADHIEVSGNMMNLAVSFTDQGKFTEAIAIVERVLTIRRAQPEPSASEIGRTLVNLAQMLTREGRLAEAHAAVIEGESLLRSVLGDDHPDLVTVINVRAQIHLGRGELGDAERSIREAIRLASAKFERDNPVLHELHTLAAEIALGRKQPREAAKWLATLADVPVPDPETRGKREFVQARIFAELGQLDEALTSARSAKATLAEATGFTADVERARLDKWLAAHE